uniref:CLASP_N domain-containing protein n=1 Tax=Gongylonema pulchrum TaxID=637853 RepID=A0A183DKA7_9BILA
LPSSVCGQLVTDVLEKTAALPNLRNRALQFLNTKLLHENSFVVTMNADHLNTLIEKFNTWIQPIGDKIDVIVSSAVDFNIFSPFSPSSRLSPFFRMTTDLCQKAAHTLKLIARSMSPAMKLSVLSETLELAIKLVTSSKNCFTDAMFMLGKIIVISVSDKIIVILLFE